MGPAWVWHIWHQQASACSVTREASGPRREPIERGNTDGGIETIVGDYTRALITGLSGLRPYGSRESIARLVENQMMLAALQSKHPAFREEREFRIVVYASDFLDGRMPDGCERVRRFGSRLVPYLEIVPASGELPLLQVVVGPKAGGDRAQNSVDVLLGRPSRETGFPRVTMSEIPCV